MSTEKVLPRLALGMKGYIQLAQNYSYPMRILRPNARILLILTIVFLL